MLRPTLAYIDDGSAARAAAHAVAGRHAASRAFGTAAGVAAAALHVVGAGGPGWPVPWSSRRREPLDPSRSGSVAVPDPIVPVPVSPGRVSDPISPDAAG